MPMPNVVRPIQLSSEGGRLWPAMFHSDVLDLRCNLFVYTPPGVTMRDRRLPRLPVLYLLHGMWGSEIDWPFKGDAQAILDREILSGRVPPMIVAMPHDGLTGHGTFYSNWYSHRAKGDRRFEDYMLVDLRRFVEAELTGGERGRLQRAVAGLSMGGFGSLALSLRHPDQFVAAASLSGAVRPIGSLRHPELGQRIFGPLSEQPGSYRRRHDPAWLVKGQAGREVALYLDCGDRDGLLSMNRKLDRRLTALRIEHAYHEYPGAHDWPSWRKRLPHALRFLGNHLVS
ncbi:MAG: alpha/beta hydrolase family protein [Phycisphaerae bacterium]|nr:alpha/beta hydrolase family protein [Phycisphaerae bacterium]